MTAPTRARSAWEPVGRKRARYLMRTRYAGMPGYVPADPVHAHVVGLVDLGLTCASIARDAELSESAVLDIYLGIWATVRIRVAERLMAVTHTPNERQGRVLAIGGVRRLRALHALGWGWAALAEHCPLTAGQIQMLGYRAPVTTSWATWHAVTMLYESLSATPGPSRRARAHAARQRWDAPLDWEGHNIDDPRATVDLIELDPPPTLRTRSAARTREVQALTAQGRSAAWIADRMGISERQVTRLRAG